MLAYLNSFLNRLRVRECTCEMQRRKIIISVVVVACGTFAALLWSFSREESPIVDLPPVVDTAGNIVEGAYASLEEVSLGGGDQWIFRHARIACFRRYVGRIDVFPRHSVRVQ